jgi:hypothetical protein
MRMIRRAWLGFLCALSVCTLPVFATGNGSRDLNVALTTAIERLDREASVDAEGPSLLADLIEKEYGTSEAELKWGVAHKLSWGEITTLAYIQATTGKSFAEMNQEDARRSFWSYAENAGMSCEKMAHSLDDFVRRAERERNTRIFDKLRASRRVHPLPDLGSGFGLFQEALDFRRIDSPRITKIHDVPGELAKGGK